MAVHEETAEPEPEHDGDWQFAEWPEPPSQGGLLRDILDSVRDLREEVATLRADLESISTRTGEAAAQQLRADIDRVRDAIPSDQLDRITTDLSQLRTLLIGPG